MAFMLRKRSLKKKNVRAYYELTGDVTVNNNNIKSGSLLLRVEVVK